MKHLKAVFLSFVFLAVLFSLLQASDNDIAGFKIYIQQDGGGCGSNMEFMENPECYVIEWDSDRSDSIQTGSDYLRAPNIWRRGLIRAYKSKGTPGRFEIQQILENIFKTYGFDPFNAHTPKENINIRIEEKKPYPYYNLGNHSWSRFIYDSENSEEIVKAFHLNPDDVMCEIQACDDPFGCKKIFFKKKSVVLSTTPDSMADIETPDETADMAVEAKEAISKAPGPIKVMDESSAPKMDPDPRDRSGSDAATSNIWIYVCMVVTGFLIILVVIALIKKNHRDVRGLIEKNNLDVRDMIEKNHAVINEQFLEITNEIYKTESERQIITFNNASLYSLKKDLKKLSEWLNKYFKASDKISADNALDIPEE